MFLVAPRFPGFLVTKRFLLSLGGVNIFFSITRVYKKKWTAVLGRNEKKVKAVIFFCRRSWYGMLFKQSQKSIMFIGI